MNTNTNKNIAKEIQDRYGHLLDKYINAGSHPDPRFHKETREYIRDVENGRYGHLLDHVSNPLQKIHDSMVRLQDDAFERRKRKNEGEKYAGLAARGRIQAEKINERKHADRIEGIKKGLIERKKHKLKQRKHRGRKNVRKHRAGKDI